MSAATLSAAAAPNRSVPWRNLAWVTWRRHRTTVLLTLAVIGVIGAYLVVSGLRMRSAWNAVRACTPQHSSACQFAWQNFHNTQGNPGILGALFLFAPLLIGTFVGAPLVGRELESGTFRYAWTQGIGRRRWMVAMTVSGALAVAVLAGVTGALVSWHDGPLWQSQVMTRLQPSEFASTGIAVVGWALAAYAIGLLAGMLWRRVLAAVATGLGASFGLAYLASRLRTHYLPVRLTHSLDYIAGSQPLSQWWEHHGARVSTSQLNTVLRDAGLQQIDVSGGKTAVQAQPGQGVDPISYLTHHGYQQWTSYQPGSHYWPLQWIELGWLSIVSLLLIATAMVLLGRRDA